MKRRDYLTGLAGVGALGATGSATADDVQFLRTSSAVGDDTHHPGPPRFAEVGVTFYDRLNSDFSVDHSDGKDRDNFSPRIVGDPNQDAENYSADDFSWSVKTSPDGSSAEIEYAPPDGGLEQYDSGAHNVAEFAPDVPGRYVLTVDVADGDAYDQTIHVFPAESGNGQPRIELEGSYDSDNGEFVVESNPKLAPSSSQGTGDLIVEWLADDRDALSTEDIQVGEGTDSHTARIPKDALGGETCRLHAAPYDGADHGTTDTVELDPSDEAVVYPNRPPQWMKDGIMYQIFPRSFEGPPEPGEWPLTNSNANFANFEERVDYLDSLNVDVLWFTPTVPSESGNWKPQNSDMWEGPDNRFKFVGGGPHGYDALSYYEVAEDLGSGVPFDEYKNEPWPWEDGYDPANNRREDARQNAMAEFQSFVEACHEKDIKVCLDFVINHGGRHHPFFQDTIESLGERPNGWTYRGTAENNENSKYFDWFARQTGPITNNGEVVDAAPAATGFAGLRVMPQWNYGNVATREHILAAAVHWADMGVDAFRCDIAYGVPHSFWKEVREAVRSRNSEFMLLDETIPNDPTFAENEFDMHFDTSDFMNTAHAVAGGDQSAQALFDAVNKRADEGFPEYTLITNATENHDEYRALGEAIDGGREDPAKAQRAVWAAGVTLPGVPFIYYGQERQISKLGEARLGYGYRKDNDLIFDNIDDVEHEISVEVAFEGGTSNVSESGTVAVDGRITFENALPESADPEGASVTVSVDGEPINSQPSYQTLDKRSGVIRTESSVLFRRYGEDYRTGDGDVGPDDNRSDLNMARAFMNWNETPEDHLQFYKDVTALYKDTPQLKPGAGLQEISFESDSDVLVFARVPEDDGMNSLIVAVNPNAGTAQVDLRPAGDGIDGTTDLLSGQDIGVDTEGDGRTIEVDTLAVVRTGSLFSVGTKIAQFDEGTGDDNGPGSYTYPTGGKYADGAFDVAEATVHDQSSNYQLRFVLDGSLENPDGYDSGVSVQHFQVYLRDPEASDGTTTGRAGTNVDFASQYQYRVVGHPQDGVIVEDHQGNQVATGSVVSNSGQDAIILQFPKSAFETGLSSMELAPLLFGYDPSAEGGVMQVESEAGTNTFGGADNDNAPNVIDAVTPVSTTQGDVLAYSSSQKAEVPFSPLTTSLETVAEFEDPAGDNKGPGSYSMPTNSDFYESVFDVRKLSVAESRARTRFSFEMENIENPYGLSRGWSQEFFQIYIRHPDGADAPTGTSARTGVNAEFDSPYHYRVVVNGQNAKQVENGAGDIVTSAVNVSTDGNTVHIELWSDAIGGGVQGAMMAPLIVPFDGFGEGSVRAIQSSNGDYQIGAENPGNAPKIMDMVTPGGIDQSQALSYGDSLASVPYTQFSEGAVQSSSGGSDSGGSSSGGSDSGGSDSGGSSSGGSDSGGSSSGGSDSGGSSSGGSDSGGSESDGMETTPASTTTASDDAGDSGSSNGGTTTAADDGPGFGTVSGLLGTAGGAAYAARRLLGEDTAADPEDVDPDAESAEDDAPADD